MVRRCQEEALFLFGKECETDMQEMQKVFAQHTCEAAKPVCLLTLGSAYAALWSDRFETAERGSRAGNSS